MMTDPNTTAAQAVPLRDAFEAWFADSRKGKGKNHAPTFARLSDDTYADDSTQRHWWTWQNAAAAAVAAVAAERERWQRIFENAQAVTTGSEDKIDYFQVPSHLMAALALALDEAPTNT